MLLRMPSRYLSYRLINKSIQNSPPFFLPLSCFLQSERAMSRLVWQSCLQDSSFDLQMSWKERKREALFEYLRHFDPSLLVSLSSSVEKELLWVRLLQPISQNSIFWVLIVIVRDMAASTKPNSKRVYQVWKGNNVSTLSIFDFPFNLFAKVSLFILNNQESTCLLNSRVFFKGISHPKYIFCYI